MKSFEQWLLQRNLIETQNVQESEINEGILDKSEPSPAKAKREILQRIKEIDNLLKDKQHPSPVVKRTKDGGKTISRSFFPVSRAKSLLASLGRGFFGMGPRAFKLDQEGRVLYEKLKEKEKELKEKLGKSTSENTSFEAYILFRERNAA